MSYRVCAKCDYVINNRFHHGDNCPECDSSEMVFPNDDPRDWNKLYKEQQEKVLEEIRRKINEKHSKF